MVNCSANVDRLITTSWDNCWVCERTSLLHLISSDVLPVVGQNSRRNLSNISKVIKLIWMYHPASKHYIMGYLHKLCGYVNDTDTHIVSALQDLVESVRPLMLLCRLCILQNIQLKDISYLDLHARLKRYLQLGDISHDHVVQKIL